ncbi:VOC family protein [Sphingomonas sp. URHD0057]|uniref:VOC family protein n=1 Tax=Sphingomonas sp. URHD0057 TaxID=1380389 RepID=UPI0018CC4275
MARKFQAKAAICAGDQDGRHGFVHAGRALKSIEQAGDAGRVPAASEGITLHLHVPDMDAFWQQAVGAGATVTMALEDQFWGDRYGQVQDPFGHRWSIGAPVKADQPG